MRVLTGLEVIFVNSLLVNMNSGVGLATDKDLRVGGAPIVEACTGA